MLLEGLPERDASPRAPPFLRDRILPLVELDGLTTREEHESRLVLRSRD